MKTMNVNHTTPAVISLDTACALSALSKSTWWRRIAKGDFTRVADDARGRAMLEPRLLARVYKRVTIACRPRFGESGRCFSPSNERPHPRTEIAAILHDEARKIVRRADGILFAGESCHLHQIASATRYSGFGLSGWRRRAGCRNGLRGWRSRATLCGQPGDLHRLAHRGATGRRIANRCKRIGRRARLFGGCGEIAIIVEIVRHRSRWAGLDLGKCLVEIASGASGPE